MSYENPPYNDSINDDNSEASELPEYGSEGKKRLFKTLICGHGIHLIKASKFGEWEGAVVHITKGRHHYHYEIHDGHHWIRITHEGEWKLLEKELFDDLEDCDEHGFIKVRVIRVCPWYAAMCKRWNPFHNVEEMDDIEETNEDEDEI